MVRIVVGNPDQPPRPPRSRKPAPALGNPAGAPEAPPRTPRNHGKLRFVGSDGPPTRYQRNLARLRPFPEDKTLAVYALGRTWKDRALGLALLRLPDHVGMTRRAKAGWARHLLFLRYLRKRGKLSELGPATSFTYETTDGKTITLGLPLIAPEPPTYAGNPDADPGDLSAIFYGE